MSWRRASLMLALAALASAPAGARAASPLVGQWTLDSSYVDGANDVTPDSSGNALDLRAAAGSIRLGPPALFGAGATLGTNATPMKNGSGLLAPTQVTLLAWIKQSGSPGLLRYVAGRGDDGPGTCLGSTYALYTGYNAKPGLRFYTRNGPAGASSALTDAPADAAVFDGKWHLIAGTFDGAAARLYVDGVLVGSPAAAAGPLTYALGGGTDFYVDGYPQPTCGNGDWPGAIDEVRVYDRALSPSELGRLAAATGPTAPALVTDASLVPQPAPPAPTPAAQLPSKIVPLGALAKGAAGLKGASKSPPSAVLQSSLSAAAGQGLGAMRSSAGSSQVNPPQTVSGLSAKQVKGIQPAPKLQDRLEAMKYGLAAQVAGAAPGQIVEAVATIALEKKSGGKVKTQTIVLPPAVGLVKGGGLQAALQIAIDKHATAAMTKNDVAKAAVSIQAVTIDPVSDLGTELAQRMQSLMSVQTSTTETLTNLLKKLQATTQAITQNIKGGLTDSERTEQKQLSSKAAKLDKQSKAIEAGMAAANQQASALMQGAVNSMIVGITGGLVQGVPGGIGKGLPTAATSVSGCKFCGLAAIVSQ